MPEGVGAIGLDLTGAFESATLFSRYGLEIVVGSASSLQAFLHELLRGAGIHERLARTESHFLSISNRGQRPSREF
jgi:hypothetical protein